MKGRRYGLIAIIATITVIAIMITASSLPGYLREVGNLHQPFEYAQMYLNDEPYSELIIEYDHAPGFPPSIVAMELLEERIYQYTDKHLVSSMVSDEIDFGDTRKVYHEEHIYSLKNDYKDHHRGGDSMVIHVTYLDGEWKEDNVLGLSYGGDRIVIFMETIINVAQRSQNIQAVDIESSVLVHEWGHLLGLVGIGYESGHEDPEYQHHCDESAGSCVMNADIEIRMGRYSDPPPTDFCVLCQEDMLRIKEMEDEPGLEEYLTIGVIAGIAIVAVGWILVLIPKKEDKKQEFDVYKEHYNEDFGKRNY